MSRPKHRVVLSELAELDLADILQYTFETWGIVQMDRYAAQLEQGFMLLASAETIGLRAAAAIGSNTIWCSTR